MPPLSRSWIFRFLAYGAGFVAVGLALWIDRTFGQPSIDQIVYHLVYAEGAALQMSELFIFTFVAEVIVFPLAFAAAIATLHMMLAGRWPEWNRHVLRLTPSAAVAGGALALLLQFSVFSYAAAQFDADRFGERYVDPASVQLRKVRPPRNLLLVYVESLEETYGDRSVFGRDLLAALHGAGGRSLARMEQAPGANWTIAGMVATQCGVPLKVYSEQDIRREPGVRAFLPGATCLGDQLAARGWHNVFLGGAPLSFSGKGSFLQDHGYAEAFGRDEWARAGLRRDEVNQWGLYDSALFERARRKLTSLHEAGQPFMLTLLTLDTHNPYGFMSPECRRRGAHDFAGIVECSSAQLAEFVAFVRAKGYLEDTVVVILGDHLAVPNPVYDQLLESKQRSIFNRVIAQDMPEVTVRRLSHFDLYPTLMELVGFHPEGGRLGLGTSVFAESAQRTDDAPLPLAALSGSGTYRRLWQAPP